MNASGLVRTDGTLRPTMADMFMEVAEVVAKRSTCPEGARHGAVIARHGRIAATGYGSPAAGVEPCPECWLRKKQAETGVKDWSVCPSVHAEANALANAAKHGVSVYSAEIYLTKAPCDNCLRLLVNSGIWLVIFRGELGGLVAKSIKPSEKEDQWTP